MGVEMSKYIFRTVLKLTNSEEILVLKHIKGKYEFNIVLLFERHIGH